MAENQAEKQTLREPCWYVVHTYSGYENKVKDNIEKVETHLRFCAGIKGWLQFEKTRNICNDNYNKMCEELSDDEVYKSLKGEVDRFIGQKWRHFIFDK
jgi:hypothetical protein